MTRSIQAGRLAAAMKKKFANPAAVLKRLGIDADLLSGSTASGNGDPAQAMSAALQQLLGELHLGESEVGRILEVIYEHAPTGKLDDDDPNKEKAAALAGEDDDDDAWVDRIKAFLKEKGLSDADIERAAALVRTPASDEPAPAPRGFGGALSRAHDSARGSFADRHPEVFRVHGFGDSSPRPRREISRGTGSFADRHPEVSRILPC